MTVVKYILLAIYIIVCIALILVTTFQSKDNSNKGRTKSGKAQRNTIILGTIFIILSIITVIVFVI